MPLLSIVYSAQVHYQHWWKLETKDNAALDQYLGCKNKHKIWPVATNVRLPESGIDNVHMKF